MTALAPVMLAAGTAALLSLAYNTIVARQLGPVAYAEFAAALGAATMLAYAGGALAPITAHLSARYMASGEPGKIRGLVSRLLRQMFPLLLAGAVITAIVAAPAARALHFASPVSIAVAYVVLAGLLSVSIVRSATRGAQQFVQFGIGVAGEATVRLAAGWLLLRVWPYPESALAAYCLALLLTFMWTLRGLRLLAPAPAAVPRGDVAALLGTTTVLVVAMAAFQSLDLLIVKRSFAPAIAGIYAAAWTFARWMAVVAFPIEALLLPRLTFEGERGGSIGRVALQLGLSMLALGAAPLAMFALAPSRVVNVLYGAQYGAAAPLLFPLALAAFAQYASYLIAQALLARAYTWPVVIFAIAGATETTIVIMRHDTLATVASILVTARAATFVTMLILTRLAPRTAPLANPA